MIGWKEGRMDGWVELHVTQAHLDQGKISCHVATPSALSFRVVMLSTMGTLELVLYFWNPRNNQCSPGKQAQGLNQEHNIFE